MHWNKNWLIDSENQNLNDQFHWKDYYKMILFSNDIALLLHGNHDQHVKLKKPLIVDFININDWQKNVWWDWLHYTREWLLKECDAQKLDFFTVLRKTIDYTILHDPDALFALTSIIIRNLPKSVLSEDKCLLIGNIEMLYNQSGYFFTDVQKIALQTMIFKTHIDRSLLTLSTLKDNKEQILSIIESNVLFLSIQYKKLTHKSLSFMVWFDQNEEVLNNLLCYILYLSDVFPKRNHCINDITAVVKLFNQYFWTSITMATVTDRWNYNFINHYRIV